LKKWKNKVCLDQKKWVLCHNPAYLKYGFCATILPV
jgi:hypothetical protein